MRNPFRKKAPERSASKNGDSMGIAHDDQVMEAIQGHIGRYVGPADEVFHEIVSDIVHIDVHIVAPSLQRNYYTLVTSGMSHKPMNTPAGRGDCRYSELVICLPPDWHVLKGECEKEKCWWPFRLIRSLARLPHEHDIWMWTGSTVPNGDPPSPYDPSVGYCCALIATPILFDDGFATLRVGDKAIHFHTVLPLYKEEMEVKLTGGLDALFDCFDRKAPDISELMNPVRTNAGG